MRILICTNAYPPHFMGGAELVAHAQAQILSRAGHSISVFTGDIGAPGHRHSRTDQLYDGLSIHRIKTDFDDYNPEFLNFLHPAIDAHFTEVLKVFRPDIVHFHNLMGLSVKLPLIARAALIPTVCTLHDLWGFCLKNTGIRWDGAQCRDMSQCSRCLPRIHDGQDLDVPMRFRKDFIKLALDAVDRFIAPSHYIAGRYIAAGLLSKRIVVIANGIDLARFSPAGHVCDEQTVRISFVGHFGAHKGVETLLSAVALLPATDRLRLNLAGEGPEEPRYRAQIDALGLADTVRFLGKVEHGAIVDVYDRSDIVVLPSIWDENQPVCVMEAMASGLPVVASNKGGIPELIEHGRNGLLFEAGNADDLSAQLAHLINAPALRRSMGAAGRHQLEDRGDQQQIVAQIAVYETVINTHGADEEHTPIAAFVGGFEDGISIGASRTPGLEDRGIVFVPFQWISDSNPKIKKVYIIATGRIAAWLIRRGGDTALRCPVWLHAICGMAARIFRAGISRK